jgi:hypothetical protein
MIIDDLFPKSQPFPRAQFELRSHITEHIQCALCTGGDGHTVPRHCGTDAGVGKADELTGPLWRGWKNIPEHDVVRVSLWLLSCFVWGSGDSTYPLHLGLFRLDYLLHAAGDRLSLKQVEFNAISSSSLLGSLSKRAAAMHRYITSLHLHHTIRTCLHRHI